MGEDVREDRWNQPGTELRKGSTEKRHCQDDSEWLVSVCRCVVV